MKSATSIINEVREQICDGYCKYLAEYNADPANKDDEFAYDKFMTEHCDNCPLERL